jgi:glycosyltransferase involved in cell wall biosynthesis
MKISVLIPTRNRAHTLRQTIEAMQQQTVRYDELIVGDDASEDHTREAVAQFGDPRIQYVPHEQNLGIYGNWNDLIARASGDYLCIYHDHDRYLPHILERSRQILDEHPEVAFVHTALLFIDSQDDVVNTDIRPFPVVMPGAEMRAMLARGWHSPIMAATVMARRGREWTAEHAELAFVLYEATAAQRRQALREGEQRRLRRVV